MPVDTPAQSSALPALAVLTPREREVMYYIALGKLNKVIAAEVGIAQRTIEAHRTKIFHKLKVRNAVELVHYLIANNIELDHFRTKKEEAEVSQLPD